VTSSLAWCSGLLAVAVPLTVRRFSAKTTERRPRPVGPDAPHPGATVAADELP
jgi:hypothetical protein